MWKRMINSSGVPCEGCSSWRKCDIPCPVLEIKAWDNMYLRLEPENSECIPEQGEMSLI